MVYNSLKTLLKQYPYFLDKRPESNFYKTREIWNNRLIELYNDLFQVYLDSKIRKHILIWKTQTQPYEYTINFAVSIPLLKKVTCYKNNVEIYSKEYSFEDEEYSFYYTYEDSTPEINNDDGSDFDPDYDPYNDDPEGIANIPETRLLIPDDKYSMRVETYHEYVLEKGFPENDIAQGDIYDHDASLDEWGALFDIPRKKYTIYNDKKITVNVGEETETETITVSEEIDYSRTEPAYNNRLTEDDYHYMNRILYLAEHVNDIPLPLLELWKLFGDDIDAVMTNRDDLLCRMFTKSKHLNSAGVYNESWVPEEWEHKDSMHCPREEDIYFYAMVNNASPIYGRDLKFTFKFYNSLVEPNTDYKYIRVYLNGEEYDTDGPLTDYLWVKSTKDFGEEVYDLRFIFRAYTSLEDYNDDVDYLESEEIEIIIKGCGNADYYVNYSTGSDKNTGTRTEPFKTLAFALSKVESNHNVIVLQAGTHIIENTLLIDRNTSILSCNNATIKNNKSCDIFYVANDHFLDLINVRLKYKCCEMYAEDERFSNNNKVNEHLRVTIPLSICRIPVKLTLSDNNPVIYAHTDYNIIGEITTLELTGNKVYVEGSSDGKSFDLGPNRVIKHLNVMGEKLTDEDIRLYNGIVLSNKYLIETKKSVDGEYIFDLRFNKTGEYTYTIVHPESEKYCDKDTLCLVKVEDMPTTLTAEITEPWIYIGETLPITYTLKDYYNVDVENGEVILYEDNKIVQRINPYANFNYTPKVGEHTYKVVYQGDSYVTSIVDDLKCLVRKYDTSMFLLSSNSRYNEGDTIIVTGTITDELGRPVNNANIKLYDDSTLISQSNSKEDGSITFTISNLSLGKHYLQLKYNGDNTYNPCESNIFTVRVRSDALEDINLYLYPDYKILNMDTYTIPVNVYATDKNGNPISTTFKMWTTYDGEINTIHTTGSDGWSKFNLPTNSIHYCHGTVIQAISNIDEDIYSNIVFIRDYVDNPLIIEEHELFIDESTYSYKDDKIHVNGYLVDNETSVIPNEALTVQLLDATNKVIDTETIYTNIKGEYNCTLTNNGVRLDTLKVKVNHKKNNNYTAFTDNGTVTFYPPKTTITSLSDTTVYTDITKINIPVNGIDEFNKNILDGWLKLTLNNNNYNSTMSNGAGLFSDITRPKAGVYTCDISYYGNVNQDQTGGEYYQSSNTSFKLTVLKQSTSLTAVYPRIVFSDQFTITGVLTNTTYNTKLASQKVYLYVDGVKVANATTKSNGSYSFKYTISDTTNPHEIYVSYAENDTYLGSTSGKVNVEVNKETSVLAVGEIKNIFFEGDSATINGKLLTDDGEVITEPVLLYVNNVLKTTLNPDNTGYFTYTLSDLTLGTYNIRLQHNESDNYTASSTTASFIVKEDTLELYAYIDSEDETGDIYYGEEFLVTVLDSVFEEIYSRPEIYENLEFTIYDKQDNLLNIPLEVNTYIDAGIYTVQYGSSELIVPGDYYIKIVSPETVNYPRKELIVPFTVKDNLKIYSYLSSQSYDKTVNTGEVFIVTVIDKLFGEDGLSDIYSDVYENLQLTVYDSDNNIVNVPYEVNIYDDSAHYTLQYGSGDDGLSEGDYKVLIVSPATSIHGKKQTSLNIHINYKEESEEEDAGELGDL